jgi:hypothetical protein
MLVARAPTSIPSIQPAQEKTAIIIGYNGDKAMFGMGGIGM